MSQICNLTFLPSIVNIFDAKSTPMVASKSFLNTFSVNCVNKHDFPTSERRKQKQWLDESFMKVTCVSDDNEPQDAVKIIHP